MGGEKKTAPLQGSCKGAARTLRAVHTTWECGSPTTSVGWHKFVPDGEASLHDVTTRIDRILPDFVPVGVRRCCELRRDGSVPEFIVPADAHRCIELRRAAGTRLVNESVPERGNARVRVQVHCDTFSLLALGIRSNLCTPRGVGHAHAARRQRRQRQRISAQIASSLRERYLSW